MSIARIAIFASGNGTNAEVIFRYFAGHSEIQVVMLLSNNTTAYALERARKLGVETHVFTRAQFFETDEVVRLLETANVTHVVLAGFLWLIPENLLAAFPYRIINIHPALLPKFGGKGMFGMRVHQAVKAKGETLTGITIHLVNKNYDEGKILLQKSCVIEPEETPEQIASKVNQLEYQNYPVVIQSWINASL